MSETDHEAAVEAVPASEPHAEPAPETEPASEEPAREGDDTEHRLRREMALLREQAMAAQAAHDAELAAIRSESGARVIRAELRAEAIRSGIIDLDALRLVDIEGVSIGDDGEVTGADAAIKAFKDAKPYLFTKTEAPLPMVTTSAPARTPAPAAASPVDARALDRQQWQAARTRLLAQQQKHTAPASTPRG